MAIISHSKLGSLARSVILTEMNDPQRTACLAKGYTEKKSGNGSTVEHLLKQYLKGGHPVDMKMAPH